MHRTVRWRRQHRLAAVVHVMAISALRVHGHVLQKFVILAIIIVIVVVVIIVDVIWGTSYGGRRNLLSVGHGR